jgi:hypothetical protein
MRSYAGGVDVRARFRDYAGNDFLSQKVVRYPQDGRLTNFRVSIKHNLNFLGKDALASSLDEL